MNSTAQGSKTPTGRDIFTNTVLAQLDQLSTNGGRDHDDEDSEALYCIVQAWELYRSKKMGTR
jgi:hypothetical protein